MGIIDKLKLAIKDIDVTKVSNFGMEYKALEPIIAEALSGDNKEENAKEIVDNLDFMLSITNFFNHKWIINAEVLKQDHYVTKIIDNIDSYKYKKKVGLLLIGTLKRSLNNDQVEELYSPKMFQKLFECDLDEIEYESIFRDLDESKQRVFINELIKSGYKLDFSKYTLTENNKDLITDNIEYLADVTNDLYHIKANFKDMDTKKIDDYINNNPDKALDSLINRIYVLKTNTDTIKEIVKMVIKDVIDNEKIKYSDITSNKAGAFSSIIMIGDKVIKIGLDRATKNFPNNPYVIKPLLRKTLKDKDKELFIEVTERVIPFEVDAYKENPELKEELYELYKKVRNSGLIWTDVRMDNVGRLLKDNDGIYWKDPIEPSDEILEYDGRIDGKPLKKGELVILDADHIHSENDNDILSPVSAFRELFEARYQNEKVSSKRKGFSTLKLITTISISTTLIVGMFITYMFMQ